MYPKDTEKWKQFTTDKTRFRLRVALFCIPKILKNESNSQQSKIKSKKWQSCFVSQRYWKMKAIHNHHGRRVLQDFVVLYPKDTEKWKQFTTAFPIVLTQILLFCIPKILKNESNSQHKVIWDIISLCCFVSQRYWKMKAIHNFVRSNMFGKSVVLYPKDTEKWKQFTTSNGLWSNFGKLFCIPKILKNESNSQLYCDPPYEGTSCFVSQRYWKMKAIHNCHHRVVVINKVVLYPKDTEKWKQFTTKIEHGFLIYCCFVSQRYWKMKAIHN